LAGPSFAINLIAALYMALSDASVRSAWVRLIGCFFAMGGYRASKIYQLIAFMEIC